MASISRNQRYLTTGAGAQLIRVEVLVPPGGREAILALAKELRDQLRPNPQKDAALKTVRALTALSIWTEFQKALGLSSTQFSLDRFAEKLSTSPPDKGALDQYKKLRQILSPKVISAFEALYGIEPQ